MRRHRSILSACVLLALLGALARPCLSQTPAGALDTDELQLVLNTQGDAQRGREVFRRCENCHRKDASGRTNGIYPRLAGQHASVMVKQIVDIRAERRHNPAMQPIVLAASLSPQDIADVTTFLQGLPIPLTNGKGPGVNLSRGKHLYEQDCATCHGASGEGSAAKFYPMVAAQHYRYLLREVISIRDGERRNSNPEMVTLVKTYSAEDMQAVADYMSHLPPPARD